MAEKCEGCGGEPHDVALESRYADCVTCGGRIHYYPAREHDAPASGWVHLNNADWLNSPHPAEPAGASA